ncbi:MAG: hypothetical protein ABSA11_14750 [Candidatus Bathyarchaeia archaeon]|jgi:uncharacterized Zn finger protein
MKKPTCPKCGSEDLEDDMITIYSMWGELIDTEQVKKCKKCGEVIREETKSED